MTSLSLNLIKRASRHYRQWFNKTPIEYSKVLSDHLQTPAIFKLETMHVSGSYKLRCAHFAFENLSEKEKKAGIAVASDGYFGLAYAYVCFMNSVECHIYTPNSLPDALKEKILGYEAMLHKTSKKSFETTEVFAKNEAIKKGLTFIGHSEQSCYAGCGGALVKEIMEDVPQLCTLVMPKSSFGLLEGAKFYLSNLDPGYKLIACKFKSEKAFPKMLSGNARYDELKDVSLTDTKKAMKWLLHHHQFLVEDNGVLALASLLKKTPPKLDGPVCVVLSGRYLNNKTLKSLL